MSILSRFMRTGALGVVTPGADYRDVVDAWGEPEAFAKQHPDPVYCLYGDLELAFTKKGRLYYLQIEPGGSSVSLPAGPGERLQEPLPEVSELVADLVEEGFHITEVPHPFEPEVIWSRIDRSGVEFRQDDSDGQLSVHLEVRDIYRHDHGITTP
ncbi:hypothetical protein K2224_26980 [Streptomyces sp. BHT-5-2]|uniref:hypothetical protein n=1 Tax=Streptomyces sp. BHT-5-2 TaxID=2866715 RepID=UPI001C8EE151|nr:hypothetical protein [Streptomyces sp. BHT-5-2]QZL06368.1 hypothetical protein K2224_26980 [Streptomyces sp. BHT-5-2]